MPLACLIVYHSTVALLNDLNLDIEDKEKFTCPGSQVK